MVMLCDLDQSIQNSAANEILSIREIRKLRNVTINIDEVQGGSMEPMEEAVNREVVSNNSIRKYAIPNLNLIAKAYNQPIGQP